MGSRMSSSHWGSGNPQIIIDVEYTGPYETQFPGAGFPAAYRRAGRLCLNASGGHRVVSGSSAGPGCCHIGTRHALSLWRIDTAGFRLQWTGVLRLLQGGHTGATFDNGPVSPCAAGRAQESATRRPGLLQDRPPFGFPRRHLCG